MKPIRTFRNCLEDQQGLAYLEFALSLSILLMLLLGSVETSRYVLILQKLEKTVSAITDVTTQADSNNDPLTTTEMSQLMGAVPDMMSPYTFGASGLIIITDVTKTGNNNPVVNWQYCGGGTLTANSHIGTTVGGQATLPAGFTLTAGEEVVIGEIFYAYSPVTTSSFGSIAPMTMYRTAIFMPRLGALTGFSSHC